MHDPLLSSSEPLTTGLPGLDRVLQGVMPGDNIVWQVEQMDDYRALVLPYADAALRQRRPFVYFRFASHSPLLAETPGLEIHELHPEAGFEQFTTDVHTVIRSHGPGAVYVFDGISELAAAWRSDQMLGNFFMLTCPLLLELKTLTYFALLRHYHASFATRPITDTTQYLIDVFRHEDRLFVRPIKTQYRSASALNMMHEWKGTDFIPVTSSAIVAELLVASRWPGLRMDGRMGFWRRIFNEAQDLRERIRTGSSSEDQERVMFDRLSRMILSQDPKILHMVREYFTLDDIFNIWDRMIGIGLIGGKAVGMLLARAMLQQREPRFRELLEAHDSFFIGADVFYTYLVRNGVWPARQRQRDPYTFLENLDDARARILEGDFQDYTVDQFREMLDYYGEVPIIVRSSSLLEDNYGNAFAGKYDSVFCVNQGSREKRLSEFLNAVRVIYASTMSEEALRYRARRGLLARDEQMALLVMRVSGSAYGNLFYPQMAGVGFSFNPYKWSEHIDPQAGVVRLVFGLGTRAVDRSDDDYTRVVALNAPQRRPEASMDEVCRYAQRRVDYLNLKENRLTSGYFVDLIEDRPALPLDLFATADLPTDAPEAAPSWVLTFDRLLSETSLVRDLREILRILQESYRHPVDIEFTANFFGDHCKINLLQCRPLQVRGSEMIRVPSLAEIPPEDVILAASGAVIGTSRIENLDRLIYVVPDQYGILPISDRFEIARLIGEINRLTPTDGSERVMILGPGRWGTRSPDLGIPVNFHQINRMAVVCEIVAMHEHLIPDVSLGTHFLNELVEMNMLYLALFPRQRKTLFHEDRLLAPPNQLSALLPNAARWENVVRVLDAGAIAESGRKLTFIANAVEQQAVCYLRTDDARAI
ncbi:MAG: pyruvate, phosphate dikinase [Kiritimatiellae bacterium]|nr:pyruvate, phosphate dikinase [Kiritimatiellia bacterium]